MRLPSLLILSAVGAAPLLADIPVRGRVVDEHGAAAAAVRVELHRAPTSYELGLRECCDAAPYRPVDVTKSDAGGLFELAAATPGRYEVLLRAAGRLHLVRSLPLLVQATDLEEVRLVRTVDLRVTVVDPEGLAVPGARVRVSFLAFQDEPGREGSGLAGLAGSWQPPDRFAAARDDGTAVLRVGENEVVRVVARAPGFVAALEERLTFLTEKRMRLERGVPRRIEVRDPGGMPVAGALLRLDSVAAAVTGDDGRQTVTVPLEHPLWLAGESAAGLFGRMAVAAPSEAGDKGLEVLTLAAPGTLSGRVTDAATGRPLGGAWLSVPDAVAQAGADGTFTLPFRVGEPSAFLHAGARGYLPQVSPVSDRRGTWRAVLELALTPCAALAGIVVDEAEAPVRGAEIFAVESPADGRPFAYAEESFPRVRGSAFGPDRGRLTRSRADGRFRLGTRPGELYQLRVSKPPYLKSRLEATPGGEPVVVVLRRGRAGYGRVVDPDDRGVAGAEVRLWPVPEVPSGLRDTTTHRALTDDEGGFEVPDLRSGRFDLRVTAGGFAPLAVEGLDLAFDPGEERTDLGTVVLEPGVRVAGRVIDTDGRPVAGVQVAYDLWSSEGDLKPWDMDSTEVETDADGRFVIADLLPGEKLDLSVWHRAFASLETAGVVSPAEDLELVLRRGSTVRGRVIGPGGATVPEADVLASYRALHGGRVNRSTRTAADGSFELAQMSTTGVVLSAEARGYRGRRVRVDLRPDEEVDDVALFLESGVTIDGRVVGPSGDPVAGAHVVPRQQSSSFWSDSQTTDGEGRFRLGGLEPGPLELQVRPPAQPSVIRRLELEPGDNRLEIRLEESRPIHGRVIDGDGVPVQGASVQLGPLSVSTGESGAFVLEKVPEGVHRLTVRKKGYVIPEGPEVVVEGGPVWDVEVVLRRGGAIAGTVYGLEEATLPQVQVLGSSLEGGWSAGRVDYDGRYRLADAAPGRWRVEAVEPGGRSALGTVVLEPGVTEVELDLEFRGGLAVSGRVFIDGEPEAGGTVVVRGLDVISTGRSRTDFGGAFRVESLTPGRYRMSVRDARRDLLEVRELDLASDVDLDLDYATGTLYGRVVDAADANPLDGAGVTLEGAGAAGSGESQSTRTDSRGFFRFDRLAAGFYRLRVEHEGYAPLDTSAEVEAGSDREELLLGLERTSGLVLRVSRAGGGAPESVSVVAFQGSGAAGDAVVSGRFLVTDQGLARVSSVPPGPWTLLVRGRRSATVRLSATSPGDAVDVVLPPATRLEVSVPALEGGTEIGTLTLAGAAGPFAGAAPGGPLREWQVRSGWAAVEDLPPGAWVVTVSTADGTSWTGRTAGLAGGGSVQLVLE